MLFQCYCIFFNDTAGIVQLMQPCPKIDGWEFFFLIEDFYFAVRPRLEVALVKVVHTNETVLASGCICGARRMHGNPGPAP